MRTKRSRRSTEITVETDEIVFLRGVMRPTPVVCPVCRQQVSMISPGHAARIAGVSTHAIYAWVKSGSIHFAELPEGSLLICLDSLSAAMVSVSSPSKPSS